jgi:hypothetical protein
MIPPLCIPPERSHSVAERGGAPIASCAFIFLGRTHVDVVVVVVTKPPPRATHANNSHLRHVLLESSIVGTNTTSLKPNGTLQKGRVLEP